ncbi:MAG: hypothetical protein JWP81_3073 [Ferruginibacter sp.]|nr:hypothetical protein [Ferruginibacter sp.]
MFNQQQIETRIIQSRWWQKAANTVDCHYSNTSGIMLTHHLQNVHENIEAIFNQSETGFYRDLFALVQHLQLDKEELKSELKITALLHDIGKTEEDKTLIIPHPLTGKPAHKRHGLVSLVAAMEILDVDLSATPEKRKHIYRTIELHDMSYGMYREYNSTRIAPLYSRWTSINDKIHLRPAAGLLYLLIFKLADIHGHANISDVLWFYKTVKASYFNRLNIGLPIPAESDIR